MINKGKYPIDILHKIRHHTCHKLSVLALGIMANYLEWRQGNGLSASFGENRQNNNNYGQLRR